MKANLSTTTTFRLGGPCRELATVADAASARERMRQWNAEGMAWRTMGGGSNLLVADEGLDEAVLRIWSERADCSRADDVASVSAGTALDDLARFAAEEGYAGLGFASGIPGTVGGGICGNAGAFGSALGEVVERVEVLSREGHLRTIPRESLRFDYRHSSLREAGVVVVRAWFRLAKSDRSKLADERSEILAMRRDKHPDWRVLPTAGSFFKNLPAETAGGHRRAAGKYLEAAGAKAMREGGAYVYEKHANILIAGPGATARDVWALSQRLAKAVHNQTGIALEPEVQAWGFG